MRHLALCALLFSFGAAWAPAQRRVTPTTGLVVTESVRLAGGTALVAPPASDDPWQAAITVRGDNVVLDLAGSTLHGTPETVEPDQRTGTAIRVEGNNVTIRNGKIRGYKVAIIAKGAKGLKILNVDASYNWKQRLKSTLEREHLDDWMSYHQNEKDEWLRYGAAFYLRDCDGFEVKGSKATGGQCGLMVTESDDGLAWNNDFSFLSAVGVGLYRSSKNRIMHNAIDWCVRGYSHGVYNRGQDSTGILIYEQSNGNTFAYNTATHGGDGFFLWAGQTTMDNGKGGCNDNVVYGNDFSYAPANGIEATFSRNTFVNNMVRECWHGVWGGYSFDSLFGYNFLIDNEVGIAIEHGQSNTIRGNYSVHEDKSVELWQNPTQDPNWGYPKFRDTKSRDAVIVDNYFGRPMIGVELRSSTGTRIEGNRFQLADRVLVRQGDTAGLQFKGNTLNAIPEKGLTIEKSETNKLDPAIVMGAVPDWNPLAANKDLPEWVAAFRPEPLRGGANPFLLARPFGKANILVDQWGPYDFRSPRLWPQPVRKQTVEEAGRVPGEVRATVQEFRVLGPLGKWRLVSASGASIEPREGDVPGTLTATLEGGKAVDMDIRFEYVGEETVDYRGIRTGKGKKVSFGYSRFYAPIAWNVKFFAWDEKTDPRTKADAFAKLIAGTPLHQMSREKLDFGTSRAFVRDLPKPLPADRFATVAEGTVELPQGDYALELTTDDGARLWIDGKKAIDEWKYQGPTTYTTPIQGGKRRIRIEHFEIDGYAALQVEIRKAS